jgi:hypothetical protein
MVRVGVIDIHIENIAAARRSWQRVLAVTDPDGQQVMRALWATVWARVLLKADEARDAG